MKQLIKKALIPYCIGNKTLVIEKELHINSWNSDLHYKIVVDGIPYSARFIRYNRSPNNVFGEITNEILYEQTKFCRFLVNNKVPFMRLFQISEDEPFTTVEWKNEVYRFILFEWIEGQHITHCDEYIAEEFGKVARRFHDISSIYKSSIFPKKSHLVGYSQFTNNLRNKVKTLNLSLENSKMIEEYLEITEHHIKKANTKRFDFILHSDLNPLNILWNENKRVLGIVDFESIGYSDRTEGLAWLIKWYSRTNGINSHEMSPKVANSFLKGYNSDDFLSKKDYHRLSSLIWLSGCINWNFVKKTTEILETNNNVILKKHIETYKQRGEKLLSLILTN
ncbi:phosphotransferase enzyme family protein [Bacillus cereus]|uniref:phosphotransferase enzyme family protein n=1 Tax=Bacillus cereus TaxID=1396 RepID=UPI0018F6E68B|nr:aminoglycoside phosphotransferase family protein [Bacillus cereus]MBJ7966924.1 aminoglycoside phosphotransferase family protein [Bacillus cereus]MBJ8002196.1 aminoglycoside phosphotransferase family protein [Bacillus cereus]